jgi:DNA-binding IclR family transcriptional regulator
MAASIGARRAQPGRVPAGANYHTHALTRGLLILDLLAAHRGPLTLQDLHTRSDLPKSTLVRLLSALSDEEFIVRVDQRPAYRLGHKVLALARSYVTSLDVTELAGPSLSEVAQMTGHTCNLGVLDGRDVVHVAVEHSNRPLRFDSRVGERARTYCTGLGKMLLSGLPDNEVQDHIPRKLDRLTDTTITSRAALLKDLGAIRERGFSIDNSEHSPGLSCVSVPVVVEGHVVAAVSVSGPAGEFDDASRASYVQALSAAAKQLSADADVVNALAQVPRDTSAGQGTE